MSCGGGEVAASGCELFGAGQGQPRNPGSAPGRDGPPRPRRPPATGSGRDDWPALPRHARTCPATTSGRVRPAHRGTAASRSSATSRRPNPSSSAIRASWAAIRGSWTTICARSSRTRSASSSYVGLGTKIFFRTEKRNQCRHAVQYRGTQNGSRRYPRRIIPKSLKISVGANFAIKQSG